MGSFKFLLISITVIFLLADGKNNKKSKKSKKSKKGKSKKSKKSKKSGGPGVNECTPSPNHACSDPNAICVNDPPGHSCKCKSGYNGNPCKNPTKPPTTAKPTTSQPTTSPPTTSSPTEPLFNVKCGDITDVPDVYWAFDTARYCYDDFVVQLQGELYWRRETLNKTMGSSDEGKIGNIPEKLAPKNKETFMVTNDRGLTAAIEVDDNGEIKLRSWTLPTVYYSNVMGSGGVGVGGAVVQRCPLNHNDPPPHECGTLIKAYESVSDDCSATLDNAMKINLDGITFLKGEIFDTNPETTDEPPCGDIIDLDEDNWKFKPDKVKYCFDDYVVQLQGELVWRQTDTVAMGSTNYGIIGSIPTNIAPAVTQTFMVTNEYGLTAAIEVDDNDGSIKLRSWTLPTVYYSNINGAGGFGEGGAVVQQCEFDLDDTSCDKPSKAYESVSAKSDGSPITLDNAMKINLDGITFLNRQIFGINPVTTDEPPCGDIIDLDEANWDPDEVKYCYDDFVVQLQGELEWKQTETVAMGSSNFGFIGRIPENISPKLTETFIVTNMYGLTAAIDVRSTGWIGIRSWTLPTIYYSNDRAGGLGAFGAVVQQCEYDPDGTTCNTLDDAYKSVNSVPGEPSLSLDNVMKFSLDGITFLNGEIFDVENVVPPIDKPYTDNKAIEFENKAKEFEPNEESIFNKYIQSPFFVLLALFITLGCGVGFGLGLKRILWCCYANQKYNKYSKVKTLDISSADDSTFIN